MHIVHTRVGSNIFYRFKYFLQVYFNGTSTFLFVNCSASVLLVYVLILNKKVEPMSQPVHMCTCIPSKYACELLCTMCRCQCRAVHPRKQFINSTSMHQQFPQILIKLNSYLMWACAATLLFLYIKKSGLLGLFFFGSFSGIWSEINYF